MAANDYSPVRSRAIVNRLASLVLVALVATIAHADSVIDFEDLGLPPHSYYNGNDLAGQFTSRGARFDNDYSTAYHSWEGWSASTMTDSHTPGVGNQYSSYAGGGVGGGAYGVAYLGVDAFFPEPYQAHPARITLPDGADPVSVSISNTTYAAKSMLQGDQFAKRFGGPSGNDPDFFRLTIWGVDGSNNRVAAVDLLLADYMFPDNQYDYVLEGWRQLSLAPLAGRGVRALEFELASSDVGYHGMNTPAYFAMDNLILTGAIPPPLSIPGDATVDGRVGKGDAAALTQNYSSSTATWREGDFNGDRHVSLADLTILQSQWGRAVSASPAAESSPIPEPSALALALANVLGLWAVAPRRQRRSKP